MRRAVDDGRTIATIRVSSVITASSESEDTRPVSRQPGGMNWKRKSSGVRSREKEEETRERLIHQQAAAADLPDGGKGVVPRGCVAVLVGDDGEERVVVEVRALGQPCVKALLDMAAREFGYDQKGLLRIPCAADEFRRAVAADSHRTPPCSRR